jgi:hypothetical protein
MRIRRPTHMLCLYAFYAYPCMPPPNILLSFFSNIMLCLRPISYYAQYPFILLVLRAYIQYSFMPNILLCLRPISKMLVCLYVYPSMPPLFYLLCLSFIPISFCPNTFLSSYPFLSILLCLLSLYALYALYAFAYPFMPSILKCLRPISQINESMV